MNVGSWFHLAGRSTSKPRKVTVCADEPLSKLRRRNRSSGPGEARLTRVTLLNAGPDDRALSLDARSGAEFKDFRRKRRTIPAARADLVPPRRTSWGDVFQLVGGLVCDFDDGGRGLDGEVAEGAGVE
jgi:hypothetical protein